MNRREWKKARRTLRQQRIQTIMTLVAIAIGVIGIIAAVIVWLNVRRGTVGNETTAVSGVSDISNDSESNTKIMETSDSELGMSDDGENANDLKTSEGSPGNAQGSDDPEAADTTFSFSDWRTSHTKVRGLYVTGPTAGSARFEEILSLIDNTELNAIVLDIKNDEGNITFKMENGTPVDIDACVGYIRDIGALMDTLKEHEVYTIARIACFKDPILANAKEECALRTSSGAAVTDGGGLEWVNPCSEEVWDYLIEIAEYCADLGFDEIQYDYVRFPVGDTAAGADYGVELTDVNKHEYIERFLDTASERLHAKGIPVTADVFGTVIGNPVDIEMVGQDYARLASCTDALCPMVYPSHYGNGVFGISVPDSQPYDTVLAALESSVQVLSDVPEDERAVVRPWLQSFTATWVSGHISYGEKEIRDQIRAVYDAGYDEWILWNAKNNYIEMDY